MPLMRHVESRFDEFDSNDSSDEEARAPPPAAASSLAATSTDAAAAATAAAAAAATATAVAARRLRTAMRNTTAALRKELVGSSTVDDGSATFVRRTTAPANDDRFLQDQLPPPLPLMQAARRDYTSRIPKTGFGADAVPCCRTPHHILTPPRESEPLQTQMTPEQRAELIAKLQQYDHERNDPNTPLSPLFINRIVYDCTASPVFSKRWRTGQVLAPDGVTVLKCTCLNCTMYAMPSAPPDTTSTLNASASAHDLGASSAAAAFGAASTASLADNVATAATAPTATGVLSDVCNGEWRVEVRSFYTPTSPDDTTLVFESRFESGNLRTAFQVSEHEYDLTIRPDFNTTHHTQFYYFSVRNTRRARVYKFNILNFTKPASLYNAGMQPLVYSTIDSSSKLNLNIHGDRAGWRRAGSNVCYYQNHLTRGSSRQKSYFTLSFTIAFDHDDDTVYFAYAVPYTYTNLNRDLDAIEADPVRSRFLKRRVLTKTLAGNACDVLTITNFIEPPPSSNGRVPSHEHDPLAHRRGIVYTARVHPGETQSSWIMRGCIQFLTDPHHPVAHMLRELFIFKLVPMLNPDGVVVGNYRCSLAGVDLNRQWASPSALLHPTIHATKEMIHRMAKVRDILMCVDLHGHSRKLNIFIFGCPSPPLEALLAATPAATASPTLDSGTTATTATTSIVTTGTADNATAAPPAASRPKKSKKSDRKLERQRRERELRDLILASPTRLIERVFPRLLAEPLESSLQSTATAFAASALSPSTLLAHVQKHPTGFHLHDCTFNISRGKESTMRVVLYRELGLLNSFTLEASFAGASVGQLKGLHYNTLHYERMGASMVETLAAYIDPMLHEAARQALCESANASAAAAMARASSSSSSTNAAMLLLMQDEGGVDESDDSSDSPDEVGLPLTVGRAEAAAKRTTLKQKKSRTMTAMKAMTSEKVQPSASSRASSPSESRQKLDNSKPVAFSSTAVRVANASIVAAAAAALRQEQQERLAQAAQDESDARRRKRAAVAAIAARRKQREEPLVRERHPESTASVLETTAAASTSAALAGTPAGLGISSYYRPIIAPTPARANNIRAHGPSGASRTVTMILNEEEERLKLAAAAAAPYDASEQKQQPMSHYRLDRSPSTSPHASPARSSHHVKPRHGSGHQIGDISGSNAVVPERERLAIAALAAREYHAPIRQAPVPAAKMRPKSAHLRASHTSALIEGLTTSRRPDPTLAFLVGGQMHPSAGDREAPASPPSYTDGALPTARRGHGHGPSHSFSGHDFRAMPTEEPLLSRDHHESTSPPIEQHQRPALMAINSLGSYAAFSSAHAPVSMPAHKPATAHAWTLSSPSPLASTHPSPSPYRPSSSAASRPNGLMVGLTASSRASMHQLFAQPVGQSRDASPPPPPLAASGRAAGAWRLSNARPPSGASLALHSRRTQM